MPGDSPGRSSAVFLPSPNRWIQLLQHLSWPTIPAIVSVPTFEDSARIWLAVNVFGPARLGVGDLLVADLD